MPRRPSAPKVSAAMLAKLSVDLRIAIDREGRLPDAVLIVFPEPKKAGQTAMRVNEYETNERIDEVIEAASKATEPGRKARLSVDASEPVSQNQDMDPTARAGVADGRPGVVPRVRRPASARPG